MKIEHSSLLITLSTYPFSEADNYIKLVEKNISGYKEKRDSYFSSDKNTVQDTEYYYKPIKYHIFGNYDIAFISLIDNLAISNKIFLPTRLNEDDMDDGVSKTVEKLKTRVFSGISVSGNSSSLYKNFGEIINNKEIGQFVCICNLKLNNAFLIGNGYNYIKQIINYVEDLTKGDDIKCMIVDSLASFELSVLLFSENIEHLKNILLSIRGLTFGEVFKQNELVEELHKASLYSSKDILKIKCSHVFVDTQSFFGVRLKENSFEFDISDEKAKSIQLESQIEWEVKPGHESFLKDDLDKFYHTIGDLTFDKGLFLTGKTDFLLPITKGNSNSLYISKKIFEEVRQKSNVAISIKRHVRRFKTKLLFSSPMPSSDPVIKLENKNVNPNSAIEVFKKFKNKLFNNPPRLTPVPSINIANDNDLNHVFGVVDVVTDLRAFAIDVVTINEIRKQLKSLKISSAVRSRIIKTFYNYNSAIQNPLSYNLFLDLRFFMEAFKAKILDLQEKYISDFFDIDKKPLHFPMSIYKLETELNALLDTFEESFNLRYINNYHLDEVSDFLIAFNTPLQKLIASLDNYFKALSSLVIGDERSLQIMTTVNRTETNADFFSVNFSLYNLYEPGILFYGATKEIFTIAVNTPPLNKDNVALQIQYCKFLDGYFFQNPEHKYFCDKTELKKFPIDINVIDILRYQEFFNDNFELFIFWHFAYMVQNSYMYDTNGKFNEVQFLREISRLVFLALYLDYEKSEGRNDNFICYDKLINCIPENKLFNGSRNICSNFKLIYIDFLNFKMINKKGEKVSFTIIMQDIKYVIYEKYNIENDTIKVDLYSKIKSIMKSEEDIDFAQIGELIKENEYKYFCANLTYAYLEYIFEMCEKKVPILTRLEKSGKPIFEKNKNDFLFLYDPQGGAFFPSFNKLSTYSRVRNTTFTLLNHHGFLFKKILFKEKATQP